MATFARGLAGVATAALLAAVVPAFAAPRDVALHSLRGTCDSDGIVASFGPGLAAGTRLDHVLIEGIDPDCIGHIVTVEIAGVRQGAVVDGPRLVVPIEGDVPLGAVTAITVSVRRPERATR